MSLFRSILLGGAAASLAAGAVLAAAHGNSAAEAAIKARQAHMSLYSFNIGTLGGMAKGAMEYDAAKAGAAAANIVALSKLDQGNYWVEGSSTDDVMESEALPAIWTDMADFNKKMENLTAAATTMEGAAGQGLEALQASMKELGGACGACHKAYRKPE